MPLTDRPSRMPSGTRGARRAALVVAGAVLLGGGLGCDRTPPESAGSASALQESPSQSLSDSPSPSLTESASPPASPPAAQPSADASDAPPLTGATTVTGRSSSVTGTLEEATLTAYATMADRAVTEVAKHWTRDWSRRLVIVAPKDIATFREQLGRSDDLSQVAAVTVGPLDADGRASRDRIVLNPEAFSRLTPEGRQFVITHEATHVALRNSLPGAGPLWLVEGYADHVGYAGSNRPETELAAELLDRVRRGEGPGRLPVASDFTGDSEAIAPTYLAAWLAVDGVAATHGEAGLRRFVEAATVTGGESAAQSATDRAFREVLGTTREAFTTQWLARLAALAAQPKS